MQHFFVPIIGVIIFVLSLNANLIMKNKIITLAVLREARIDENRTPFSPSQISNLLNKFSNLKIIVQPSKRRCFKNEDYLKAGAQITDDLSSC